MAKYYVFTLPFNMYGLHEHVFHHKQYGKDV